MENKIKYNVGDETNFLINGVRAKVEEVVDWKDGVIRYKLERYGGLLREEEV